MEVKAPQPRNIAQEGRDTLQAQIDLAPQQYAADSQYAPLYADLDVQTLRRALLGGGDQPGLLQTYRDIAPGLNEFQQQAASGQRAADIADVETLAPRATAALRAANPEAAGLELELLRQAQAGLDAGSGLDPQLAAEIAQDVRGAQAARGFGMGAPDANVEALFTARERVGMRDRNRTFAQSVLGQSRAGTADPFMAILGRPSGTAGMAGGLVGQAAGAGGGAPDFDPFNAYAADLYGSNANAEAGARIASTNNSMALFAGLLGLGGPLGGGWLAGRGRPRMKVPFNEHELHALREAATAIRGLDAILTPLSAGWLGDGQPLPARDLRKRVRAGVIEAGTACGVAAAVLDRHHNPT